MRSTNCALQKNKSVRFASQAKVGLAAGGVWYSSEELSSLCTKCPTNYLYCSDTEAIDAILDAQELLDSIGATDVASQASILAAVSAKCSAEARHRAHAEAKKVHASCYCLPFASSSQYALLEEEMIPLAFEDDGRCYQRHGNEKNSSVIIMAKQDLPGVPSPQVLTVVPGSSII